MSRRLFARGRPALFALTLAAALGSGLLAQPAAIPTSQAADPSPHRVGFVTVNGNRIAYLDWGGSGPALVFFPGMANSAHVFDEFALRFTDQFRVVGVTRIGFGESDQPERDGYDLPSRVAHIRAALDALNISRAVLIGHSLGGDEITAFAVAHPNRTAGLIYLDAAIDHTAALRWQQQLRELGRDAPTPGPADTASAQAFQRFLAASQGVESPIGEVLAMTTRDASGVVLGQRAAPRVFSAIFAATVPPEFAKVKAPALSLYSDYVTAADLFPFLRNNSTENARVTAILDSGFKNEMAAERARFTRDVNGAQVFAYPAHHYQFLSMPEDTERRMRAFLTSIDPR